MRYNQSCNGDSFKLGFFSWFEQKRSVVRMAADTDDYDLKQMKDMAAARKRWDALVIIHKHNWCLQSSLIA